MDQTEQGVPRSEPPIGMYFCKLDDRTRLKLPADWFNHFKELGVDKLFVTSLDRRIAQIYTIAAWRECERKIEEYEDPEVSEAVLFNAVDLGATVEIDTQGRVTFPQKLRDELKIEGQLQLYGSR